MDDYITFKEVMDVISLKHQISVNNIEESCLDVILMNFSFKLLTNSSDFLQSRIELDMFRYCIDYSFCKGFSAVQISKLLSILMHVHAYCIYTIYDNLAQTQLIFIDFLHQCSLTHVPFSTSLFSAEQCLPLIDYFTLTYFYHFYLYKYVFTSKSSLQLHVLNRTF